MKKPVSSLLSIVVFAGMVTSASIGFASNKMPYIYNNTPIYKSSSNATIYTTLCYGGSNMVNNIPQWSTYNVMQGYASYPSTTTGANVYVTYNVRSSQNQGDCNTNSGEYLGTITFQFDKNGSLAPNPPVTANLSAGTTFSVTAPTTACDPKVSASTTQCYQFSATYTPH